ncbi:hypothetical protein BJX62DRAFT_245843 [Aspergillus germanicus]
MQASDIIKYIVVPVIAVVVGAIVKSSVFNRPRYPWNPDAQQAFYQMQPQALPTEIHNQQPPGGIQSYGLVLPKSGRSGAAWVVRTAGPALDHAAERASRLG